MWEGLAELTEVIEVQILQHFDRTKLFSGELSSVVFVFSAPVFSFFL